MDELFLADGYAILPGVFCDTEIACFQAEADRISDEAGSACVRNLCKKSSLFRDLSVGPRFASLLSEGFIPVRSILFDKTPQDNWPVSWHQDLTIAVAERIDTEGYGPWSMKEAVNHVQPPDGVLENMATIRIHLDDTPAENGALWVIPGSHRNGKIAPGEIASSNRSERVACECRPGDVLLMSPLILHASRRSEVPKRRRVLHFEYAKADILAEGLRWHEMA